ncbi:MAG TPA: DUF2807 domain-containing protein [Allosphingosinicella sp.]|jgi:hypothetical protein
MNVRFICLAAAFAAAAAAPLAAAQVVTVPAFTSVQLRGGGSLVVRQGPVQRVTLVEGNSGETRIRVTPEGELRINACTGTCPKGYKLVIEVQTATVPGLAVFQGGRIDVDKSFSPQASLSAAVSGGGQIDARAVVARNAAASLSGGGTIRLWAEQSLSASVSGGGHVGYLGRPVLHTAIHSGTVAAEGNPAR